MVYISLNCSARKTGVRRRYFARINLLGHSDICQFIAASPFIVSTLVLLIFAERGLHVVILLLYELLESFAAKSDGSILLFCS